MRCTVSRGTLTTFTIFVGAVIALNAGVARGDDDDDADDVPVASMGEFRLHDGESKLIVDPRIVGPYRICLTSTVSDVPLAVIADDVEATVRTGACQTFDAGRIRIAAAGKLDGHSVLVGTFEHVAR